jgi:hypothetical protein
VSPLECLQDGLVTEKAAHQVGGRSFRVGAAGCRYSQPNAPLLTILLILLLLFLYVVLICFSNYSLVFQIECGLTLLFNHLLCSFLKHRPFVLFLSLCLLSVFAFLSISFVICLFVCFSFKKKKSCVHCTERVNVFCVRERREWSVCV